MLVATVGLYIGKNHGNSSIFPIDYHEVVVGHQEYINMYSVRLVLITYSLVISNTVSAHNSIVLFLCEKQGGLLTPDGLFGVHQW